MRTHFLVAVLGIGWAMLTAPACTSTAMTGGSGGSRGSGGGGGQHANMDAGTSSKGGASPTGGTSGGGTSGGGVGGGTSTGGSGGSSCALAIHLGSTACNACASTTCCNEATSCDMPDQGGGGAAGTSGCAKLAACVSACLVGTSDGGQPAGTVPDCFDTCNPSHVYNVTQITNAQILIACLSNGCASTCR